MNESLWLLTASAASLGFIHTIIGPDHYLPFIMMGKVQQWTRRRTLVVTALCGIGHVLSSVLLGFVGIGFGIALQRLELIEGVRGELAAWALISFGLIYAAWGIRRALKDAAHEHAHAHEDGTVHTHHHSHLFSGSSHRRSHHRVMTTWALFTIFVLGPCEPLIPLLMFPAAQESVFGIVMVASVFGIVTIATMLAMVWVVSAGLHRLPMQQLERWTHALAGGIIACSGLAIQFLGL